MKLLLATLIALTLVGTPSTAANAGAEARSQSARPEALEGRALARQTASGVTLSDGDLPHAIILPAADADALGRRPERPPTLKDPPPPAAVAYTVSADYWDRAVRGDSMEGAEVDREATYYPATGLVRARQGDDDVWFQIDLRQRSLLDRYIRLGRSGSLSPAPGVVEVLRAAVESGEVVSVQVGPKTLDAAQTRSFWREAATLSRSEAATSPDLRDALAVTFGLPEGRAISLFYSPASRVLHEPAGAEAYQTPPDWLLSTLGLRSTDQLLQEYGSAAVPQDSGPGSPLWWPAMVGVAVALLALAAFLDRRLRPRSV